jgi:hypothetical protein
MKLIIILILFLPMYSGKTQPVKLKPVLDQWDRELVRKANTAVDTDYLSDEEKTVILITNLARLDGRLFTETILNPFLEGRSKTKYTRSLIRDLSKTKDLPVLKPQQDLYNIARQHAVNSGKKGITGHEGFDRRFKPLLGKYRMVAENCAYGFEDGMTNVLQLLIDEDIPKLGHRKNLLSADYNSVGVSIQYHKKYRYNCVIDFGKIEN